VDRTVDFGGQEGMEALGVFTFGPILPHPACLRLQIPVSTQREFLVFSEAYTMILK
jgi:hypothetical protein